MSTQQAITKGVIAVAGSGTRFLPATKSLPKEMLPIIDKPIVHYVVEEMVNAGITDIVMVTRSDKKPLEDYFDQNALLEEELRQANKLQDLEKVEKIHQMANFIYIRQKPTSKASYGNGIPVLNASSIVGDEPFVFAYGDDLVKMDCPEASFTQQLVENYEKNHAVVIGCQEVPENETHLYGMIKLQEGSSKFVEEIIEKPDPGTAPSRLAAFGRFVLTPEICQILQELEPGKGGELWLTDAIEAYIQHGKSVVAQPVQGGRWLTTGDPLHFLEALLEYAREREEYWEGFKQYFLKLI
ncbi:UTP-glucose-1-phosphate uridylyltransferase [Candidatus Vecturithrix granuli]|uniref:UTP--glucose-1-phosphate uridylyltransferase n=1 Tax=Vecturithrix granuli TaxID=1499967 RepID=A0A081C842_VECG1|nr:UTP-glucose-1-phosphate uridylyltransferase [Candidatus Vecturithrix granuli]